MAFKRLIAKVLFLVILGTALFTGVGQLYAAAHPGSAAREQGMKAPQMKIAIKNGLISLDVRDTEIAELLQALAKKTGIALTVGKGVEGRVSLKLEGVSLEEALRQLCSSRAIIYELDHKRRNGRIIEVGAFASSAAPAAAAAAAPQSAASVSASAVNTGETPKQEIAVAAGEHRSSPAGPLSGAREAEQRLDSKGRLLYKPRELLVRFKEEATAAQIAALHLSAGSSVLKRMEQSKIHRVRLGDGLSETGGVALYRASKIVATVEQHALRYPMMTPNDPYFVNNKQWGLSKIQLPAAWEVTTGSSSVTVAVIDTGVDMNHPDLNGNIWTNTNEIPGNGLDDDNNGYIDDRYGWNFAGLSRESQVDGDNDPTDKFNHGTHVAGIIAAVGNNGIGVAGIGWNLRIMPLKVLSDADSAMEEFDVIAAIDYAIAMGARIVNCSFGGEEPSRDSPGYLDEAKYAEDVRYFQLEYEAFDRLRKAGILAVCAAGNDGVNNDTSASRIYPASHDLDNIVSVTASNSSDALWGTSPNASNYGKNSVDLMAPGDAIRSTCICRPNETCDDTVRYCEKSGSSMAAAHVSGVAGLIISRYRNIGYSQLKSVLLASVDKIGSVSDKLVSGGRLNAAAALREACLAADLTGGVTIGLDYVIRALRIASGSEAGAADCGKTDVDGDGRIGLAEAIYGLQVLAGLRK